MVQALAFAPWGTRSSAGQVKARAASSGRPHAHPLRLPVASSRASRGTVPRWLVAPASATEGGKDVETERPEAGEAAEDKDEDPRFYWDAANLRWVRDKRGQPLSAWKEGGYTQIKPKTGEAYTVWPAVHIALTNRGLKSIPVEEALKMCQENKAIIVDVRPEYQYKKSHADPSVNVPLYRAVQGTTFFDQVKKLATAAMAMQATERNPDFGQDAKAVLGDEERLLIVACTIGGTLETKTVAQHKPKEFNDPEKAFGLESRSLKGAYELIEAGYENVAHLEGGLAMWDYKELPVTK